MYRLRGVPAIYHSASSPDMLADSCVIKSKAGYTPKGTDKHKVLVRVVWGERGAETAQCIPDGSHMV